MVLTAAVRQQLRSLWLLHGGEAEDIRSFHAMARRAGIMTTAAETARFLREFTVPPEVL